MTQEVLNCLQGFGYNLVTSMNTNFVIISKTTGVPCVIVVLKQKQPVTFSCVAKFSNERQKIRDDVYRLDASIKQLNEESLIDVLLHGSDRFNDSENKQILLCTICYIQATKRFERPLIDQC